MAPTSTPIGALAGQDQAPPPVQQAPETPDTGITPLAGPSFAQQVGQGANDLAEQQGPQQASKPGAWARTLVGAVQSALAGFGAGGRVPPGAGALYGVGAAARQAQERTDKLQQQQVENQQKQQQMGREEAIARATIAHENAATAQEQMLTSQLSQNYRQKNIEMGNAALGPYVKAGAGVIQQDLDSDEVQALISSKKLDPTQQHAFATGQKPILDSSGKPMVDAAGNPEFRPTYTVVGDVPQVELDDATSKLISENTPYKLPVGSKMSGLVYGTLVAQAQAAQTAQEAVNQARRESGLKDDELTQQEGWTKMLPAWGSALSKSGNDPLKALHYMETNPQMKQQFPDAATTVEAHYTPKVLEDARKDRVEEAQKQEELNQKAQEDAAKDEWTGSATAKNPQEFLGSLKPEQQALLDDIHSGRIVPERIGYLITRNPQLLEAVAAAYPDIDTSKLQNYPKLYQDFTSGKDSQQIKAIATAFEHLNELDSLNTMASRIPGSDANRRLNDKLTTVSSELAGAYGENTEQQIKQIRADLGSPFNRKAAIQEQAKSLSDRYSNIEQQWKEGAPSAVYEAQMPQISAQAKQARASLDPRYAQEAKANPTPQTHVFNPALWQKANPNGDVNAAIAAAKQQGFAISP
jgi:hypothetical protein